MTPDPPPPSAVAATPTVVPEAALDVPLAAAPVSSGPSAPFLPRSRLDPGQDAERSDLWLRVRSGFAMADLDNDLVRKWEQWYARDPAYVQRMTERGGRYLFHVMEEIDKRKMPAELALLPFIESAFNPQALSHAKASGMWQFMPPPAGTSNCARTSSATTAATCWHRRVRRWTTCSA